MGTRHQKIIKGRRPGGRKHDSKAPLPWARQPEESLEAFQWFVVYRDLPNRSVLEAARVAEKPAKSFHGLAAKFRWQERAASWDNEVDRRIQNAEVSKLIEMRNRQIQIGIGMQSVAASELQALNKIIAARDARAKATGTDRPLYVSPRDLVHMLEAGAKLERLNRGEPDNIVQVKPISNELESLSKDELRTYHDLLAKMQGGE
jgi:hypothetical protein